MNLLKTILLLVVLIVVFVGYRLATSPSSISDTTPAKLLQPGIEEPAEPVSESVNAPIPSTAVETARCLTLQEFDEHPLTLREYQELAFLLPNGSDIDAYRGIGVAIVQSYADQGDSAAMALLGAQAVMRAFGVDEAEAIGWLNYESSFAIGLDEDKSLSPEASLELNDAAFWFYQAALHGRLYALLQYGSVRDQLFGGPVGLGWLTQEQFDVLTDLEKLELNPSTLYYQAVLEIAPTLSNSWIAKVDSGLSDSEPQRLIRESLAQEFRQSLAEAELSLPDIPPTNQELESLVEQICAEQLP